MAAKRPRTPSLKELEILRGVRSDRQLVGAELIAFLQEHGRVSEAEATAEAAVVGDLRRTGLDVNSVWDLVNTRAPSVAALPTLLRHLQESHPQIVRQGLARALAVPEAKFAWGTLVRLYRSEFDINPNGLKGAFAVALSEIADDEVMRDVIELFQQPRHGESRIYFVTTLKRSKLANARAALEAGRQDPQLVKEIERMLDRPRRRRRTGGPKPEPSQDSGQPS